MLAFSALGLAPAPAQPAPAGPAKAEPETGKHAPRAQVKLLENIGSPFQVYLAGESSGTTFSDANCYLVCDRTSGEAMVIDAGTRSAPLVLKQAAELGVRITLLVSTHFHGDHTGGNALILEKTPAKMVAPAKEAALIAGDGLNAGEKKQLLIYPTPRIDIKAAQGDELKFRGGPVKVIEIGGHSPGGICLFFGAQKLLFAGDALLKGTVARVGIPRAAKTVDPMVSAIRSRLLVLSDDTVVLPGHGPTTTIGAERAANPWLQAPAKTSKSMVAGKTAEKK